MRRHGNFWPELVGFPNLLRAAHAARRGKRHLPNVAAFDFHIERELCRLQDELQNRTYQPGPYKTFEIREPKPRLISAAPFRDRVVHHALTQVLASVVEPTFLSDSYAYGHAAQANTWRLREAIFAEATFRRGSPSDGTANGDQAPAPSGR